MPRAKQQSKHHRNGKPKSNLEVVDPTSKGIQGPYTVPVVVPDSPPTDPNT